MLINEALSKTLAFKEPKEAIGKILIFGGHAQEADVIEDYHQMSLKTPVAPLAIIMGHASGYYSVKVESENYHERGECSCGAWETFFPGNPIDYFFLDQFYNKQYEKDDPVRRGVHTLYSPGDIHRIIGTIRTCIVHDHSTHTVRSVSARYWDRVLKVS